MSRYSFVLLVDRLPRSLEQQTSEERDVTRWADATVTWCGPRVELRFCRAAESFDEAVEEAIEDVKAEWPSAEIAAVLRDLDRVPLTDVVQAVIPRSSQGRSHLLRVLARADVGPGAARFSPVGMFVLPLQPRWDERTGAVRGTLRPVAAYDRGDDVWLWVVQSIGQALHDPPYAVRWNTSSDFATARLLAWVSESALPPALHRHAERAVGASGGSEYRHLGRATY